MTQDPSTGFDRLVADALAASFSGWDFSWREGRWTEQMEAFPDTRVAGIGAVACHLRIEAQQS